MILWKNNHLLFCLGWRLDLKSRSQVRFYGEFYDISILRRLSFMVGVHLCPCHTQIIFVVHAMLRFAWRFFHQCGWGGCTSVACARTLALLNKMIASCHCCSVQTIIWSQHPSNRPLQTAIVGTLWDEFLLLASATTSPLIFFNGRCIHTFHCKTMKKLR